MKRDEFLQIRNDALNDQLERYMESLKREVLINPPSSADETQVKLLELIAKASIDAVFQSLEKAGILKLED